MIRSSLFLLFMAIGAGCAPRIAQAAPKAPDIQQLSTDIQELAERVSPTVVQISAARYTATSGGSSTSLVSQARATGSGAVLTRDGYIVTNWHVVEDAHAISVRLHPPLSGHDTSDPAVPRGEYVPAKLVGYDRETDLALLKVDGERLPFLPLGNAGAVRPGQLVLAFGSPYGLDGSVSLGVVSAANRQVEPDSSMVYIQTDAPINPGNSGGPLVNMYGELIGINTFIVSGGGGSDGIGFAVPSDTVGTVVEQLKTLGRVRRGIIGVYVQTITPNMASGLGLESAHGVVVADVHPQGPAAAAGLLAGDIVTSLDGQPMVDARQFNVSVYQRPEGSTAHIVVNRDGATKAFNVQVVERPGDPDIFKDLADPTKNVIRRLGILGLTLDETLADLLGGVRNSEGIVVATAAGDADLEGAGLLPGDVIHAVNGDTVGNFESLSTLVESIDPARPMVLQVWRGGRMMFITLAGQ